MFVILFVNIFDKFAFKYIQINTSATTNVYIGGFSVITHKIKYFYALTTIGHP
jgi:hypothetical protein